MAKRGEKFINKLLTYFLNYFSIFLITLVIVCFAVSYFVVIWPKYRDINESLDIQREKTLLELDEKKTFLNRLMLEKKKKLESIDKYNLIKLYEILPTKKDIGRIIKELSILAEQSGFALENIRYADAGTGEEELSDFGIFKVNVRIAGGNFEGLKSFLQLLSNNVNIMDITSIKFDNLARYDLEINTYYK